MKLSKRDINLLLILLGIIIVLVCYLAIRNPMVEENDILRSQIGQLSPELAELQAKIAKLPEFEEGIRESREIITTVSESFPVMVRQEDFIMYVVSLENHIGLDSEGMRFVEPSIIAEFEDILAPDGTLEFEAKNAYRTAVQVDAILTYNHVKELVQYIYNRSTRTTLDSLSISYNAETGVLFGTAVVAKYFMTTDPYPYTPTYVPPMPTGVPNPFNSLDEIPEPEGTILEVEEGEEGAAAEEAG